MDQDQDSFDLKIKQDFIAEALEMLGWVEDQFLIFEQNPTDSKVVDEIFRMAHTVKGSAMTCGFVLLGEFAHVMETLLVKIREGKHHPDSETVDVLLRANDTLRSYLELLRGDFNAVLNTESMREDLMYFIGEDISAAAKAPMVSFGFFDDDEEPALPLVTAAAPVKIQSLHSDLPTTPRPILTISAADYDLHARSIEELSSLGLKAYLDLSADQSAEGIRACLSTLEEMLVQLKTLRES